MNLNGCFVNRCVEFDCNDWGDIGCQGQTSGEPLNEPAVHTAEASERVAAPLFCVCAHTKG